MAQATLSALDTWTAKEWRKESRARREEIRQWRAEDMEYRAQELDRKKEEREFREQTRRWRQCVVKEQRLHNSRYLWTRLREVNRRSVEEKAEHMRAMSWITAIIGGFTMTAPVEFIYADQNAPGALVTIYATCTALVPLAMIIATMVSVFVLGGVLRMGKSFVMEKEEEEFIAKCREFSEREHPSGPPPHVRRTFDRFWELRCEDDWRTIFFLFSLGVSLFFVLLASMAFLKFYPNHWIPIVFSIALGLSCAYWFTILGKWGAYLLSSMRNRKKRDMCSAHLRRQPSGTPFDWHLRPEC